MTGDLDRLAARRELRIGFGLTGETWLDRMSGVISGMADSIFDLNSNMNVD